MNFNSVLNRKPTIHSSPLEYQIPYGIVNKSSRSNRQRKQSNSFNILETDEDELDPNKKIKPRFNIELVRSITSLSLPTTKNEANDFQEKSDGSARSAGCKSKRNSSIDRIKVNYQLIFFFS